MAEVVVVHRVVAVAAPLMEEVEHNPKRVDISGIGMIRRGEVVFLARASDAWKAHTGIIP
jgi:hypothetical protein